MQMWRGTGLCLTLFAILAPTGESDAQSRRFNWDQLGAAFCQATLAGDYAQLRPLLTDSLAGEVEAQAGNPRLQPPRTLFQSYTNEVPVCTARTRNAAILEITRSNPGGAAPIWREYAVIVPEVDGTSRIDDVLFATRRSDTLRARLDVLSN